MKTRAGLCVSLLLCLFACRYVHAGPVMRPSRMVREIYPEVEQDIPDVLSQGCQVGDMLYPSGSVVGSRQPCLKCSCISGSVRCEAEACVAVTGCKAVSWPGRCCPHYQCECAMEGGRVYANGERLPQSPGNECSVCYCRGGHVQCAEVGCYTRDDCEPRFVQGECCPKYDHCPPRDPLSERLPATTPSLQSVESDLLSGSQVSDNSTPSSTQGLGGEEGSGDDEPVLGDEPRLRPSTPVTFSIREIESKTNSKRNHPNVQMIKVDKSTETESEGRPQITIQEVIPPRTEFIPHKAVSLSPINPVTYKNQELISTSSPLQLLTDSNNELTDSESYASEKAEVYDHPPPVLRIGDQLLFIKQGQLVPEKDASTPSPVITLIGAEGLQIGLGSGELIELPVNRHLIASSSETPLEENQETTEKTSLEESSYNVKIISSEENTDVSEANDQNETLNEFITLNSNESSSTLDISSSTELLIPSASSTVSSRSSISEYIPEENPYYPSIPEDIMILNQDEITTDVTTMRSTRKPQIASTTIAEIISITRQIDKESFNIPILNDQTSSLDEITVIPLAQKKTEENVEEIKQINTKNIEVQSDSKSTDIKILPDILEHRSNGSITFNNSGASQEWLKNEAPTKIIIPLINENATLPDSLLEMSAPSDFDVIDHEDNNANTVLPNTVPNESTTAKISSTNFDATKLLQSPTEKSSKIVASPIEKTIDKSKETLELNEELFESGEFTTINSLHSSLMSNEDASVEIIQNDSAQSDSSDLVEMVPGFEKPIEKLVEPRTHNEEHLKISEKEENSPKADVELININEEKSTSSHVEIKDFHEEIQKRDVVKKVLKDTFENPKENIRTDIIEETTNLSVENSKQNEELNIVNNNILLNLNVSHSNVDQISKINSKEESTTSTTDRVIQKLNVEISKSLQESKESLQTGSLGVLRDYFKTQFRQYHNSKLAD